MSVIPDLDNAKSIFTRLDALSKRRALTTLESYQLERAIKTIDSAGARHRGQDKRRSASFWTDDRA